MVCISIYKGIFACPVFSLFYSVRKFVVTLKCYRIYITFVVNISFNHD